jgi:hypothetical protein
MIETLRSRTDEIPVDHPLKKLMLNLLTGLHKWEPGPLILTDDKAPVELLGMKVIDELIADNLNYYQDILDEYGISGLVKSMGLAE